MPVILRNRFLLTGMRTVSSAAVMSTHAWHGKIFGTPRDLLNLDALQRSGWTGPGSITLKNCSVSVQAIKVTLCSCGENWTGHLFRRSESADGFMPFSVWERGSARGNYFLQKSDCKLFFWFWYPQTWSFGDEMERNPLCFLISQRKSWLMSTDILFNNKSVEDKPWLMMQKADIGNCNRL